MHQAGQRHDPGEGGGAAWVPGAAPAGGVRPEGRVGNSEHEECRSAAGDLQEISATFLEKRITSEF